VLTSLILSSLIGFASVPPIDLASCEPSKPITVSSNNDSPTTVGASALHVRFSDSAAKPISQVIFTLDDGATVNDVGTFSPGVVIDHNLRLANTEATSCTVSAVTFADGTAWDATHNINTLTTP
jgi:hypothetical protein